MPNTLGNRHSTARGALPLTGGTITGNLTVSGDFRADTVVVSGAIVASGAAIAGNVNIGGDVGVSGDLTVTSLNEGPLAGFRNLLINANPVINQRGYVSGTATTFANQYTLDRWRVVTSGQSLSWTEVSGVRTVTAPSQGVVQVVESGNNLGGVHTLSWAGTARATVNTIPVAAGTSVSLPPGTNVTVLFSGGTFSRPQLEPGPVSTPFERRNSGLELTMCQRYFQQLGGGMVGFEESTGTHSYGLRFMQPMRVAPTFSLISNSYSYRLINATTVGDRTITISINAATSISTQSAWFYMNDLTTGSVQGRGAIERNGTNYINASAEL